jgi:protein phosphatase
VLRACGLSDKGKRPTNEDCFAFDDALGLFVLADGMGGHRAGEVAARIAVDTVTTYMRMALSSPAGAWGPFSLEHGLSHDGNLLRTAIHLANAQVLEAAVTDRDLAGMGTTVVAAFLRGDRLAVAHVGDSRLYVLSDEGLRQVTRDDSWAVSMLSIDPCADLSSLHNHPLRHALTSAVGTCAHTDVHIAEERLCVGDVFALTTDGVHEPLDWRLEQLLLEGADVAAMTANLVAGALARGSRDNCTAIVAQYLSN